MHGRTCPHRIFPETDFPAVFPAAFPQPDEPRCAEPGSFFQRLWDLRLRYSGNLPASRPTLVRFAVLCITPVIEQQGHARRSDYPAQFPGGVATQMRVDACAGAEGQGRARHI